MDGADLTGANLAHTDLTMIMMLDVELSDQVIAYHQRTKHQPHAMASGSGGLDWANQSDPFRRGARESARESLIRHASLNMESLSQLFFESLALSGQKSFAGTKWSLRVNPSSGNLHPTECYLIAGPIAALPPVVYHYAPKSHALELLARMERESWQSLHLPKGTLLH